MTLDSVTVPLAFAAGAASFLSPCVLPLVPVYVSYLVRSSATTTGEVVVSRGAGTINALSFVAGVSLVFITLFYALRTLLEPVREVIVPIAGVLVIAFALHLAGLIRIPGLNREYRLFQAARATRVQQAASSWASHSEPAGHPASVRCWRQC